MVLDELSHPARRQALHRLGRAAAAGDESARAEIQALVSHAEPWRRWLGLIGLASTGDWPALRRATHDRSRLVRGRAWSLLRRCGPAEVVADALRDHADSRFAPRLAGRVLARRPAPAVEALVVERATAEQPDWLDWLPLCSEAVVRRSLGLLSEHGSPSAWLRLARAHPGLAVEALRPSPGLGVDRRQDWRVRAILPALVEADPDRALDLVEALFADAGQAQPIRASLARLAVLRPGRTFDLVRARQGMGLPAPLSGLFGLVRFVRAERLGLERLRWAVEHAPACLAEGSEGRQWLRRMPAEDRQALVRHWLSRGTGSWGAFLFGAAEGMPAPERERAWLRWSTAARDGKGCIPVHRLHDLPRELREREARRHLEEVEHLVSRPEQRRAYAALLPYEEAEVQLQDWLRHPEGEQRAIGLGLLFATVRHDRAAASAALAATRKRKNEQDPVRLAMLGALGTLPPSRLPKALLPEVEAVVDEALAAADLSAPTARAAQVLASRVLAGEPERGMELLVRVLRVRGSVDGAALGARLSVQDVRRLDPVLAGLVERWARTERAAAVLSLIHGLGERVRHMSATLQAMDGLCAMPSLAVLGVFLELLARFDRPRFQARALALFEQDRSVACLPRVARLLAVSRTDLLDPLLRGEPMQGRFASGRTHWVLDFGLSMQGWTPAQQALYASQLCGLLDEPERDVPTCRWAIERLAALALAPAALLIRYASDPRPPVRDIALRALPSLDGGEGLDELLACMGDDRARIAAYALRRCLMELPRAEVLPRLAAVPLERVTVAKEVLRLMGELGGAQARELLIEKGQQPLHRDVRIALLRALWDHIEDPAAWALLEAAARDPDPVLASRLLSIPMLRLSEPADARLCALFAEVLSRPQALARLGFLDVVGGSPIRDQRRVLFSALLRHLGTPDPSEAARAFSAVLVRMQPGEVPPVVARLAGLLPRRETSAALIQHLCAALHHWAPPHHKQLGLALLPALEADRLAAGLAVPLLAKVSDDLGFAAGLERLSARGHLHQDAIAAAMAAVGSFLYGDRLARRLAGHSDARLRRVGLAALIQAARPENGWTAERRALLGTMQADPEVEVAAPAAWVFPPPV